MAMVNGRPLLSYSIEAAKSSRHVNRVVVSSEDAEILSEAGKWGAWPLERPLDLASDSAPPEGVITHALECEKVAGRLYDFVIYLQPTSPLRDVEDVDSAIDAILKKQGNSLISVTEYGYEPFKCFVTNGDGNLRGLYDDKAPFVNRQQLPKAYLSNGAIYIVRVKNFQENPSFFQPPCIPYIMANEKSIDIDTQGDLDNVRRLLT
jgi:CMP-N-acetylneuraminic acid synthetase